MSDIEKKENESLQKEFDQDWERALIRFCLVTEVSNLKLALRHPETGEVMLPHEGLAGTFEDWCGVKSSWDRRILLFDCIVGMVQQGMTPWQIANYFVFTRDAQRSLEILNADEIPEVKHKDRAGYAAAFARTYIVLTNYSEALKWAREACLHAPDNVRYKIVLADALHLSGSTQEAHEIYDPLMGGSNTPHETSNIREVFTEMFSLEKGRLPSPVIAVLIGEALADPQQSDVFWELVEDEYYHDPYSRIQHAYYLLKQGKTKRAFAKLVALVQEMPWLREANFNVLRVMDHIDPAGLLMPEFRENVKTRILEMGWTETGMQRQLIKIGEKADASTKTEN